MAKGRAAEHAKQHSYISLQEASAGKTAAAQTNKALTPAAALTMRAEVERKAGATLDVFGHPRHGALRGNCA